MKIKTVFQTFILDLKYVHLTFHTIFNINEKPHDSRTICLFIWKKNKHLLTCLAPTNKQKSLVSLFPSENDLLIHSENAMIQCADASFLFYTTKSSKQSRGPLKILNKESLA